MPHFSSSKDVKLIDGDIRFDLNIFVFARSDSRPFSSVRVLITRLKIGIFSSLRTRTNHATDCSLLRKFFPPNPFRGSVAISCNIVLPFTCTRKGNYRRLFVNLRRMGCGRWRRRSNSVHTTSTYACSIHSSFPHRRLFVSFIDATQLASYNE